MQTTLLGLAFAIILALLVALIGPFFVDWTQFRPMFEAEASRVIGLPVRVTGAIDARILPSPSLTLHGLEIGPENSAQALHARTLNVEFALAPLLSGEFRAAEAQLVAPQITIGLDANGALTLPKLSIGLDANALSIDRLSIEDGSAQIVNAATGARTTFDKFWFSGDLRSLAGPFKGEGAFVTAGELYGYRISAGRLADDGSLRIRLSLDPSERPLTAEADGSLTVGNGKPRFDGTLVLSRSAALLGETGQGKVKPPWRIETRVSGGLDDAKFDRIDFLYGPEDSGVRLTGTADLRLGRNSLFKSVLSARQLDLDRLVATPDRPTRLPADALRAVITNFAGTLALPIPVELSFSADTLTIGGAALLMFGCDVRVDSGAWTLDRVEFRAPGMTQVNLSGRLDISPAIGFNGPVNIDTNDPGALAAWIDGRKDTTTQIRPFKLRGDVVLSPQQISIDHLKAEVDRKALDGKLHYASARDGKPSRLDADLNAPDLDLDAVLAFAEAMRSGSGLQPPSEIALGVSVGRATIAGIQARNVQARLKRDAKLTQIERLSVADLGGAKIVATGRVDTSGAAPRGSVALDVEARDLNGLIALAAKFAPQAAAPLRRAAKRVSAAKLRVSLALDGPATPTPGAKSIARLSAEGDIGGLRASLHGQVDEDSKTAAEQGMFALFSSGDIRLDGQIDGDDGSAVVALLGLDRAVTVGKQPGFVNVLATGQASDALHVEGRIVAGTLDAKATGTAHIGGAHGPRADLHFDIDHANVRLPGRAATPGDVVPMTMHGRLALSDEAAKLENITATVAGTQLRGGLRLGFGTPLQVSGDIDADALDAAAVLATAIGAPPSSQQAARSGIAWSSEPYGLGQFAELNGRVDIKVARAALTPSTLAHQAQAVLKLDGSEIALDKFEAQVAGGQLAGHLSFRHGADGLATHARIEATGLDAAAVLPSEARPVIGGRLSAKLDLEASGLSPRALIGSLAGTGTVSLDDGYLSGLDPKAFDTVIRASDQGVATGATKIRDIVSAALDSGRLRIPSVETTLTINGGQVRMANTVAEATGAELMATGSLDLTQEQLDARLTLTGPAQTDGSSGRPDIFVGVKGPISSPQRTVDVSALAGWLTIRRIDQEAKKLEALEAARAGAEATRNKPKKPDAPGGAAKVETSPLGATIPSPMPPAKSAVTAQPPKQSSATKTPAAEPKTSRAEPPPEAAPPLPEPLEIHPLPRVQSGPSQQQGSASQAPPGMPLWLQDEKRPSVMDSLVGPRQHR